MRALVCVLASCGVGLMRDISRYFYIGLHSMAFACSERDFLSRLLGRLSAHDIGTRALGARNCRTGEFLAHD
jgi:hypothetical protein